MSLESLLEGASSTRKTVRVFGPDLDPDVAETIERFDVDLVHEYLPVDDSRAYLTVREGDEVVGSIESDAFGELASPSVGEPWADDRRESAFADLVAMLSDVTFRDASRRSLLATSREFEDRAYRVGTGTLRVGFQRESALSEQVSVYERMAAETDLSIHVYLGDDWDVPDTDLVVHTESADEIGEYWFVAFDGGGDARMKSGLLARQLDGTYDGVCSYDPAFVDSLLEYLEASY